jgi:glycosyltransferase involved in cell wall biosynthesis
LKIVQGSKKGNLEMKICMLANAESVHTQRWAAAFADRGHEVHLLSIRKVFIPGVNVHTVKLGPENSKSVIWKFLSYVYFMLTVVKRIKKLNPDIVNAHYVRTNGVIGAFAKYHPLIISVWGNDVIWEYGPDMPLLLRIPLRFALKRADLICSTSKFMAEKTLKIIKPEKPIEHVPFGIDCQLFKPSEKPEDAAGQFRIGCVKTLSRIYGIEYLIKAMPKICKSLSNAKLIIVGKDMMKNKLKNLASQLGVAERVEFTGFIPNEQLPQIMNSFDVLVNPTIVNESFGVVVLEAEACGVPVVATNVGGVPEVCVDGKTGFLVPAEDAAVLAEKIILLAKDPALRQRLGAAGRNFVLKNYRWEETVDKMLKLFEGQINSSKCNTPR